MHCSCPPSRHPAAHSKQPTHRPTHTHQLWVQSGIHAQLSIVKAVHHVAAGCAAAAAAAALGAAATASAFLHEDRCAEEHVRQDGAGGHGDQVGVVVGVDGSVEGLQLLPILLLQVGGGWVGGWVGKQAGALVAATKAGNASQSERNPRRPAATAQQGKGRR